MFIFVHKLGFRISEIHICILPKRYHLYHVNLFLSASSKKSINKIFSVYNSNKKSKATCFVFVYTISQLVKPFVAFFRRFEYYDPKYVFDSKFVYNENTFQMLDIPCTFTSFQHSDELKINLAHTSNKII